MKIKTFIIYLAIATLLVCYTSAQRSSSNDTENEVEARPIYDDQGDQAEDDIYYPAQEEEAAKEEENGGASNNNEYEEALQNYCNCEKPSGYDTYYVRVGDSYQLKGGIRLDTCYDYYQHAYQYNYIPESGWYWAKGGWKLYCDFSGYNYWMTFARSSDSNYNYEKTWFQYNNGFRYTNDSYWLGLKTLRYYCNSDYPCQLWIHYCGEYEYCYDIYLATFWLGPEAAHYLLYWSGLQISWEQRSAAEYLVNQDGKQWSSPNDDTSGCAEQNGGSWYGRNQCNGLRFTSDGLCIDLSDGAQCYKKWWIKVKRYTDILK